MHSSFAINCWNTSARSHCGRGGATWCQSRFAAATSRRRQRIQLAVAIPTLLASGYFADGWRQQFRDQPDRLLLAYAIPTGLGALLLLASVVPLRWMPATRRYPAPDWQNVTATIRAPFVDRRFWGLLIFRGWFSLANGVSQVVQNVFFPKDVLGFGVAPLSAMRVVTQFGQFAGARAVGKWSDRYGNRPVLFAAQLCVSLALVFYLVARPETRWLLLGAWMLFAAYVAHNICLPNLTLRLSPFSNAPGTWPPARRSAACSTPGRRLAAACCSITCKPLRRPASFSSIRTA